MTTPEPPRRRPVYYPFAPVGCLVWLLMIFFIWLVVGLFWRPLWWPWYW